MYNLEENKKLILNKLSEMGNIERIRLLDKYSKIAEPVFSKYPEETVVEIIAKLLNLKFNKYSLIDAFLEKDPIVPESGYRLDEFLNRELAC